MTAPTGPRSALLPADPRRPPEARSLRTGRWHGEEAFELAWPADWSISVRWPATPRPLTEDEIGDALDRPIGLPTIGDLGRGRRRPVIIVDDCSRPTPAAGVIDALLARLEAAGLRAGDVTIVMATGTHPAPGPDALHRKIGSTAAASCRVVVHDDLRDCVSVGKTSFGTPVVIDRVVADADLLIGVGGVYPNNTAGFGGGSKLALGILGRQSITHLHEKHAPAGWGSDGGPLAFRRDLDEIAAAIGLAAQVFVHVDEEARAVRVRFGDGRACYPDEVGWAAETYRVAGPGDADVVVANAYPNDGTLVSAWQKSLVPLRLARHDASRVLLASCPAGPGGHGLFPLVDRRSVVERARRKASVMSPVQFASAAMRSIGRRRSGRSVPFAWPIHLFRPGSGPKPDLPAIPGLRDVASWEAAIATIRAQHPGTDALRVVVYPCAPLQVPEAVPEPARASTELTDSHTVTARKETHR